jgi:hypothetical protein
MSVAGSLVVGSLVVGSLVVGSLVDVASVDVVAPYRSSDVVLARPPQEGDAGRECARPD